MKQGDAQNKKKSIKRKPISFLVYIVITVVLIAGIALAIYDTQKSEEAPKDTSAKPIPNEFITKIKKAVVAGDEMMLVVLAMQEAEALFGIEVSAEARYKYIGQMTYKEWVCNRVLYYEALFGK